MGDCPVSNEKEEKLIDKEKTEEEEFLKSLDEEFKDRYTEKDEDYRKVWESDMAPPPILLNFDKIYGRKQDNYNRNYRQRRSVPFQYRRDSNRN